MDAERSVLVLQHVACETLGTIEGTLHAGGLCPQYIRVHAGEPVPSQIGNAAGLIVLGGPMSVYEYDRLPHLMQEMRLIGSALGSHRPVLGICLGSQLLAHVLGSKVRAGPRKEIGWDDVTLSESTSVDPLFRTAPARFTGFHWHGDVFDVPAQATCLASSDMTDCQAFRYGQNAYGILFHLEVTEPQIDKMVAAFEDELTAAGVNVPAMLSQSKTNLPQLTALGQQVFGEWAKLAAGVSIA
ncbi:type 1 glutamine amidotransferase [Anatilimnocola floriformis]|uniref:type 1 glutamine amidotransferase n=1 Tax=Anatilimnocola floriformis TaxID=2948575 RepID=UPI0020C4BEBF|nr:type 1 glutamine amidotransferase [Anatilimnocola floriformis]